MRFQQHVRKAADTSVRTLRTELVDATSGARIGYALGSPAEVTEGTLQVTDAQLLLVNEAAMLLVPSGELPPAHVPLPAAPAIRNLLARSPESLGAAYVITLSGGPSGQLGARLAHVPGVLEVTTGCTGRGMAQAAPTYEEMRAGGPEIVEAVQLAVDPSVDLEALLEAFWAVHDATSEGGEPRHAACIFYHSDAQRDAACASRSRMERATPRRITTRIRPATTFWEVADAW